MIKILQPKEIHKSYEMTNHTVERRKRGDKKGLAPISTAVKNMNDFDITELNKNIKIARTLQPIKSTGIKMILKFEIKTILEILSGWKRS